MEERHGLPGRFSCTKPKARPPTIDSTCSTRPCHPAMSCLAIFITPRTRRYVLHGDMTFYCGDDELTATVGSWVFAPREIPHTFKVGPHGARALTFGFPSGFAGFVEEFGEPAPSRAVPPPGPIDEGRLVELARKYQIEIVGP